MKINLLLMVSSVFTATLNNNKNINLLKFDEFKAMSNSYAKHSLSLVKSLKAKPIKCDLNKNKTSYTIYAMSNRNPDKFRSVLFLGLGSMVRVELFEEAGFKFAQTIFDKDPECHIVSFEPESLASTQLGPGSISITSAETNRTIKNWRVGSSVTYKSPLDIIVGGGSLTVSGDISVRITESNTKSIGTRFEIPSGSSCIPYLIRFLIACQASPRYIRIAKNKTRRTFRLKDPSLQTVLIP